MSDEHKSEQASDYKLREAKKKGQLAKSIELNGWLLLLMAVAYFYLFSGSIGREVSSVAARYLNSLGNIDYKNQFLDVAADILISIASIILPFLLLLVVISVLINVLTNGFIFTSEPLKPKFEKMNPVKGFKKIFSKKNLFELFKQIIKLSLVIYASYLLFPSVLERFILVGQKQNISALGNTLSSEALWIASVVIMVIAPLVLLDVLFSKWDFRKQMMMSTREVKEEYKKKEGDPQVKSKRKEQQKELGKKLLALGNVKNADVIVNNPTHISVALKFDPQKMISPEVISSGRGVLGKYIRSQGLKHGILQIVNIPLARGLYSDVPIGHPVPSDYYQQLAPIYRNIFSMKDKA